LALRKIPYRKLAALVADRLSTDEDEATLTVIRRLRHARARGYLTPGELEAACRWKSPRAIALVRSNSASNIRAATRRAFAARNERARLEELLTLRGVSVATASAILTMLDPRRYAVLDIRCWQLLHTMGAVTSNRAGTGFTAKNWSEFISVVRQLAKRFGVKARDVERVLFMAHREYQEGRLYRRPG
jgi:thermostable 8-oxoguanine DNA glycosylase